MIHTKLSGFAVYISVSMKIAPKLKIVHFSNSVILHVICAKRQFLKIPMKETPTGTMHGNIPLLLLYWK